MKTIFHLLLIISYSLGSNIYPSIGQAFAEPNYALYVKQSVPSLIRENQAQYSQHNYKITPAKLESAFFGRPANPIKPALFGRASFEKINEPRNNHHSPHSFQRVFNKNGDKVVSYSINTQYPKPDNDQIKTKFSTPFRISSPFPSFTKTSGSSSVKSYFNIGNSETAYEVHNNPLSKPNYDSPHATSPFGKYNTPYRQPKPPPVPSYYFGFDIDSVRDTSQFHQQSNKGRSLAGYTSQIRAGTKPSNQNFGHTETRTGDTTLGRYYVNLPDGRTQIVEYTADQNGYHPTVRYV